MAEPAGVLRPSNPIQPLIESEAHRLGFQLVGVTPPDPPPHYPVFENWLAAGRHGEMAYLASKRSRQRRADPRQILPECRSILVLGMRYASPGPSLAAEPALHGRVAAYAWGSDYHAVLGERLQALAAFIQAQADQPVACRWYTDTGPLLERDLAQRAGLGWIGKNTCLIHPRLGSYIFLAELLLSLELEPAPPFTADRCGTCTRCIDACPTGCILPDRTLDARRCISYLTIELKGSIPPELRSQLGKWVFGCDICQVVCPWNRHSPLQPVDPAFAALPGMSAPDLLQELALSPETFNLKFKGSPLKRAKRRGYLRNVAVALGNHAGDAAIPALQQASHDPEPLVREHAAWALQQRTGKTSQ
jgi:epoxyqueuosine reductase